MPEPHAPREDRLFPYVVLVTVIGIAITWLVGGFDESRQRREANLEAERRAEGERPHVGAPSEADARPLVQVRPREVERLAVLGGPDSGLERLAGERQ
jgi:hypothetical protein